MSRLLTVLLASCAHGSTTPKPPVPDTAVGAYLRNPAPHRVASLGACTFEGPVSRDLRATSPGPITARCPGGAVMHWNAVIVNGLSIVGPRSIQLQRAVPTSYAYSAMYTAGLTPVAGDARFTWSLGPGCDIAELDDVGDGTFVLPKATGQCTLLARDSLGRTAEIPITIE